MRRRLAIATVLSVRNRSRSVLTLLFLFALHAIVPTHVNAQNAPRLPPELIGKYSESPDGCRSFHRRVDGLIIIDPSGEYVFGSGSGTWASIRSVRRTKSGYVLRLVSPNNPAGWSVTWRRLDANTFEETSPPLPNGARTPPTALVRCTERDAIAGIGLPALDSAATRAPSALFTAEYALQIPAHCPRLQIDRAKIETARAVGIETLGRFFAANPKVLGGSSPSALAGEESVNIRRDAHSALARDVKEIRRFCERVLDAFGHEGRVVPDLIVDRRPRAL
jgi:hypothetical protein